MMRLRRRPRINEVFNPITAPHPGLFAERIDGDRGGLQYRAAEVLCNPGEHLILWGFTGVGKTSLLTHLAANLKLRYLKVTAGAPLDQSSAAEALLRNTLAELGYERAMQARRSSGSTVSVDVGVKSAKAGIGRKESAEVASAIESNTPDRALVKALAASNYRLLFIDGLEFIPISERDHTLSMLGELMHQLSDLATGNSKMAKIVMAGVAETAGELLPAEGAVARRVHELYVPRMTAGQLLQILHRGAALLNLSFERNVESAIVSASDGFPFYTHHYAAHAIRQARRGSITDIINTVSFRDYELSLDSAIVGADARLALPYHRAIEATNRDQARKKILEALADTKNFIASLDEIRRCYLRHNPGDRDATMPGFFEPPLAELTHVFAIVGEMQVMGHKRAKRYRFIDPLMRSFVRLHREYPHLAEFTRENLLGT